MTARDPIRWGLLGTGNITRKLLIGARQSADVDVVAVGSRTADRARAFAAANDIARKHGSYDELLADPGVDAVYISLPNLLHHEWTMRSLAAGKHVLCEKPYSRRPAEVTEAFDAADAAGLVLQEAFMWRHTPQARRLVELLDRIGPLRTIRSTFSYNLEAETDVRVSATLDGGSLMDVGCYCVSGARLVAGEPLRVSAEQHLDANGVERRMSGLLRFPGDVMATFTSAFDSTTHETLEVIGRDGRILLPDPWHSTTGRLYLDDEEIRVEPINPYRLELEDMAAAIRGERPALLGRADALGQARTIEALYRSADTGLTVNVGD